MRYQDDASLLGVEEAKSRPAAEAAGRRSVHPVVQGQKGRQEERRSAAGEDGRTSRGHYPGGAGWGVYASCGTRSRAATVRRSTHSQTCSFQVTNEAKTG